MSGIQCLDGCGNIRIRTEEIFFNASEMECEDKNMTEQSWKVFKVICLAGCIVTVLIDWRITFGYLAGSLLAILLYKRNESYWTEILEIGTPRGSRYGFHFAVNLAIMAAPMIAAALFPQVMNIFAAAVGLMMIKISVVAETLFIHKKGETENESTV